MVPMIEQTPTGETYHLWGKAYDGTTFNHWFWQKVVGDKVGPVIGPWATAEQAKYDAKLRAGCAWTLETLAERRSIERLRQFAEREDEKGNHGGGDRPTDDAG